MLDYSDKMLLTEVEDSIEADVYFPDFDKTKWDCTELSTHTEETIRYKHLSYTRKK